MLVTTDDNYKYFLDGIKKEQTSTVKPFLFNRIANDAQDLWLADKVTEIEVDQKRIDDLQVIRVVTDGIFQYVDYNVTPFTYTTMYAITPINGNQYVLDTPMGRQKLINNTNGNGSYPEYYRFLNVMFKINYINDICERTGISDWIWPYVKRSDKTAPNVNNPYRKPKNDRVYYEIIGDQIRVDLGVSSSSTVNSMRFEYLRIPRRMFLDSNNNQTLGDFINPNYTPGIGSVNFEFAAVQRREIMDTAIRIYLERVKDPRYQSYLMEERIKSESK